MCVHVCVGGANRWQDSLSENSLRLSILTQHSIQTVWASMYPLISSTCSVLFSRAGINIIDVSEMNYLSLWTADVSFKDSKKYLDRISKCRTNRSSQISTSYTDKYNDDKCRERHEKWSWGCHGSFVWEL